MFTVVGVTCAFLVLSLTAVAFGVPEGMVILLRRDQSVPIFDAKLPEPQFKSYSHPTFGYFLLYPQNYLTKKISEDKTGAVFESAPEKLQLPASKKMVLRLSVHELDNNLKERFNTLVGQSDVQYYTYCAIFDDRFVISGLRYGDEMFYSTYQNRDGVLKAFEITFPASVGFAMEKVITDMYRNFTGQLPSSKAISARCSKL